MLSLIVIGRAEFVPFQTRLRVWLVEAVMAALLVALPKSNPPAVEPMSRLVFAITISERTVRFEAVFWLAELAIDAFRVPKALLVTAPVLSNVRAKLPDFAMVQIPVLPVRRKVPMVALVSSVVVALVAPMPCVATSPTALGNVADFQSVVPLVLLQLPVTPEVQV
jgi:hypothetical protein